MLDHQSLSIFVFACVAVLTAANGYLLKTWAGNMSTANAALTKELKELAKTMQTVQQEAALSEQRIEFLERDLGRLAGRECGYEGCPQRRHDDITHPGVGRG